jgi:hypothetical protein
VTPALTVTTAANRLTFDFVAQERFCEIADLHPAGNARGCTQVESVAQVLELRSSDQKRANKGWTLQMRRRVRFPPPPPRTAQILGKIRTTRTETVSVSVRV